MRGGGTTCGLQSEHHGPAPRSRGRALPLERKTYEVFVSLRIHARILAEKCPTTALDHHRPVTY
jgi:hypothetical protein